MVEKAELKLLKLFLSQKRKDLVSHWSEFSRAWMAI